MRHHESALDPAVMAALASGDADGSCSLFDEVSAGTNPPARELDVRPILRAGGEPFEAIMQAVDALQPGQSLRLLAPFEPIPLFAVLGRIGYAHAARELPDGDWEVLFSPDPDQ